MRHGQTADNKKHLLQGRKNIPLSEEGIEQAMKAKAEIDRQAHEMLTFFKGYPMYRTMAELMEQGWNDGTLMEIYQ